MPTHCPAKRDRLDHRSVPLFEVSLPAESLVDLSALSPSFTMPVQAAWKTGEKSAAAAFAQPEFALSESDFPFLDTKAEIDDYKPHKGRRHGGEQLIAKKVQGQSFVIKQVVGQAARTKPFGKKRRARLLSDTAEELHLNVPYSLNRKNRWEVENAADFLRNQPAATAEVQLTAIDQHFAAGTDLTAVNNRDILALHQLDANGDINTKAARSARGSTLAELQSEEGEQKPLALRFVLAKAHPLSKSVAANSIKNKPLARSTRRAQMDVSVYSTDDGELNDEEPAVPTANAEETTRMYAPKHQTFSLADFICEKAAPVIVRPRRRVGGVPTEEYVQVEMPETTAGESPEAEAKRAASDLPPVGAFRSLHVPAAKLGVQSRADWIAASRALAERPELHFRWLNAAQAAFQLDATAALAADGARSPLCVLTFGHRPADGLVDVLVNAAPGCAVELPTIDAAVKNGLDGLLQLLLANVQLGASPDDHSTIHTPHDLRFLSSELNSVQLAAVVQPVSTYAMLAGRFEATDEGARRSDVEAEDELADADEEDDFEHVDYAEFDATADSQLDNAWVDENLDAQVAEMRTLCDECGENALQEIVRSDACGHAFCRRCLREHIRPRLSEKTADVFACPFAKCAATVPAPLLQSVLPLSWVAHGLRIVAAHHAAASGRLVHVCPAGCGLGLVEATRLRYAHVFCAHCKNHRCADCRSPPHWPMSCAQARVWAAKREQQTALPEGDAKRIGVQFWSVCEETRQRRTNTTTARAVAKDARKIADYKFERKFVELRKACLQVVENGFAWLYTCRTGADRPAGWAAAKAALSALLAEFNLLENAIVRGQPADKAAELVQKVRGVLHKTLVELAAAASVGGTDADASARAAAAPAH